jgi:ABC-type sugar transport system substrate-binding protein
MKRRILAISLAIALAFSLIACTGSQDSGGAPGADGSPSESAPPEDTGTPSASVSAESPSGDGGEIEASPGSIGYFTDEVDHWGRDAYDFAFYTMAVSNMSTLQVEALNKGGEKYNYTVRDQYAGGDADTYVSNLQTLLLTEPDGLLIDVAPEFQVRVAELIKEDGVNCVALLDSVRDEQGRELLPCVVMDQAGNGARQLEYLSDNYSRYWGDGVAKEDIALLLITWTIGVDLNTRGEGARLKFEEMFPGNPVFVGDVATESFSAEGGYNLANSIISAHPDVKYWFIVTVTEELALGGSRAVEALMKEDCALITSSGSSILPGEWDAGYDGVWIANYSVSAYQYAITGVMGLIALADGRASMDTLWPEHFRPGDLAANFNVQADMMYRDNYRQYLDDIIRSFGLEPG